MVRVAVIGARRTRQGIGHHLARFAARRGADVVGVLGTSPGTAALARAALAREDVPTRAFHEVEALLSEARPQALVIASPAETHQRYLELALERGLHVLCEKPLVWGAADAAGKARELARRFAERGLHLVVNTQWPHTLTTYRRLYPRSLLGPPRSFRMELSPDAEGRRMLVEALPHALSLLQTVVPSDDASVEDVVVEAAPGVPDRCRVAFTYVARGRRVAVEVALERGRAQPRHAAYGFDGRIARRRVDLEGYQLWLEGEGRQTPLADPTPRRVGWFLSRVSSGSPPITDPAVDPGVALLERLCRAWPVSTPTAPRGPTA